MLCIRPGFGTDGRRNQIEVTCDQSIFGERWFIAAWMKLLDGLLDPSIQVSVFTTRVYETVVVEKHSILTTRDTIIADIACSEKNLLAGVLL